MRSNDQLKASVAITEGFAQQHKINSTATSLKFRNDGFQMMTLKQLKDRVRCNLGKQEILDTDANTLRTMIELDDKLRYGHASNYDTRNKKELKDECKVQNLPMSICKESLFIILRAYYIINGGASVHI